MAIEPEIDLYGDLDEAFNQPLEKDVEKKKAEEQLKLLVEKEAAEKTAKLENDHQRLKADYMKLEKNLSVLTLTAKNEVKR
jgi:hypothetical protein